MRAQREMIAYFAEKIAAQRGSPRDDLIGYLITARIDDQAFSDDHINGTLRLLMIAGIDTTWSTIGSCCGIWRNNRRTAAGSRPTLALWVRQSKSSCAPTRR